jgi:hypothetical protein
MSVQSPQGYAPPPPPPSAPAKKGLGPLGWILIGCGVIVILCVVVFGVIGYWAKNKVAEFQKNPAMAGAEAIVAFNPDLELVSKDENAQTLTIRNKKTNEVVTANLDDIKNGHFKFNSDKGSATFDVSGKEGVGTIKVTDDKGKESKMTFGAGAPQDLPSWVPSYPGGTVQGSYNGSSPDGHAGGFTITTSDSPDKMIDWYETQLKAAGFTAQKTTVATNGATSGGTVTGTTADQKRTVSVGVSANDKTHGAQAVVTYTEKT